MASPRAHFDHAAEPMTSPSGSGPLDALPRVCPAATSTFSLVGGYAPAAPVSRAPPGSGMVNGALLRAVDSWTHHPAYSPEGIYETADWAS